MPTESLKITTSAGHQLSGSLELPTGLVRGAAVFAHCFTCTKQSKAATAVSRALAREGIAIFEAAAAEVESAETLREVIEASRGAVREFKAHQKVRRLYTHVHLDLAKFERRLDRLDAAIDRAQEAGADVTEAGAESEAAAEDLAAAADQVAAVDPSQTGSEVMGELKEAHA